MWTGSQRPEFKDTPEIRPVHFAEMSSQKSKMLLSSLYGSDVLMPDNIGAPNEANGVLGDLFPDVHHHGAPAVRPGGVQWTETQHPRAVTLEHTRTPCSQT